MSSGDSPRRDGVEDDAVAVDLTANDDAANAVDRRLTAEESRRVLVPLLRLRQACNHPQAGTHGVRGLIKGGAARADGILAGAHIGAGGIHSGAIMSMPQIHAVLIEKQRVEAEEAQRLVAFTRNASAGVACCEARFGAAVEHYRQVLKLEASGAADGLGLRLDPLQRLHALHNLRLALDAADEAAAKKTSEEVAVSRALRDDTLIRDAETERQKYLASRAGGVGAASEHMRGPPPRWHRRRVLRRRAGPVRRSDVVGGGAFPGAARREGRGLRPVRPPGGRRAARELAGRARGVY